MVLSVLPLALQLGIEALTCRLTLYRALAESQSYRAFLQRWLAGGGRSGRALSFGEAARRCRFESRSFLKEVCSGRRSLAQQSFKKVAAGLCDLPDVLVKIFLGLVHREEPDLRPSGLTVERLERRLLALRQRACRLFAEEREIPSRNATDELITQPLFHLAYAAMGLGEQGESLESLARKTAATPSSLKALLDAMMANGWIESVREPRLCPAGGGDTHGLADSEVRYRALDAHRLIEGLASPETLQAFRLSWLTFLRDQAAARWLSRNELFNVSTFSVRASEYPELRKRLVDVIDALVEEFGAAVGEDVVQLTVSLSPNKHKKTV